MYTICTGKDYMNRDVKLLVNYGMISHEPLCNFYIAIHGRILPVLGYVISFYCAQYILLYICRSRYG